jgi:RNA polymerase nonessential primary-like sigma factor
MGYQAFLDKVADHPILTAQQERDLARRAQAGDQAAKERLVSCNVRLVLAIMQHFRNRGLGMPELLQEGIIGLHTAVEKFDPDLGYKFSTYATWWVRKGIQRGIANAGSDTIRLPTGVKQRRGEARSLMTKYPGITIEEVAELMEQPVDLIREALAAAEVVASTDQVAYHTHPEDGGPSLSDQTADPNADDPHESVQDNVPLNLGASLDVLTEDEREVISLRFGLNETEPHSISEISELLDKPVHAIQATQRRALTRLRSALLEAAE